MFGNMFDKTKANDKDYVLEAVGENVFALKYASPELQNDKDVVLKTIENNVAALHYASDDLQNDEDIKAIAESYEGFDDLGDDDPGDIGD